MLQSITKNIYKPINNLFPMVTKNRKIKIHTNHACNLKCRFCYYGDSSCIKEKDPTLDELKFWLKKAKDNGAIDVDFCGGEPTLRADFPELLEYTRKIGYRIIGVTTNGQRMANLDYVKKLIKSGLNDALFSLEGYNAKTHDYLTRVPGSFDKIIKAIKNVKKEGIILRINSTVTKDNYKDLEKFAKLLIKLKPDSVNFIKFNPWDVALNQAKDLFPRYSEMAPYLKKAIDILNTKVEKVSVRYFPLCFMKGYERHVSNCTNLVWEADEWGLHSAQYNMSKKSLKYYAQLIRRLIKKIPIILKVKPTLSFNKWFNEVTIKNLYTKLPECEKCSYNLICDGIDKAYPEIYGIKEIKHVPGKIIKDVMQFRGPYLDKYEKKYFDKLHNSRA